MKKGASHQVFFDGEVLEDNPALQNLDDTTPDDFVWRELVDTFALELNASPGDLSFLGSKEA
jgi:hypothetical protein